MGEYDESEDIVLTGPTTTEKIKGLRWGVAEAGANTVFAQLTYFGPAFVLFLNELQLNRTQIGLLLSFLPFFGMVALFVAPRVARFGYKRTFVLFWGIRKFITAFLLLVPWVQSEFGAQATLLFVGVIVMGFGLCRAIAEVGYYPWNQEFVPTSMRGRYAASVNLVSNITGIITITAASFVIDHLTGLSRFTILFGVAVIFGLMAVWFISRVPGGAPVKATQGSAMPSHRDMLITLKDRNFWLFILGVGLVTLGTVPMFSFLPLFMQQEVGLSEGHVILLQNGTLFGALSVTFMMGWASDRYGSKPVMLSGQALMIILPVIWLFIPKGSELSLPIALIAAFLQGIATLSWGIGFGRLLYVNVVPAEHKTAYMAVYYASVGIIGGTSQLVGGVILDLTANLSGEFMSYVYNPFTPLFIGGLILLITSRILFRFVRSDTSISSGQFAGMFIRGNPILAFESMFGYYRAKDERTAITMTERLGHAHSPLTVDELLEALIDPRFNVRFEAIISIARTNPDPRLVSALENILNGTELTTSVAAAWALGRIGDTKAQAALRDGLNSELRSVRAHSARALGTLGDQSIMPLLLERLGGEADRGLQMAYAAALGSLGTHEAVPALLDLLNEVENEGARMELALSLVRVTGEEKTFIRLLRQIRQDEGTAVAQMLSSILSKFKDVEVVFDDCILAFASQNLNTGANLLAQIIGQLPESGFDAEQWTILQRCARHLETEHNQRPESLILALCMLEQFNLSK